MFFCCSRRGLQECRRATCPSGRGSPFLYFVTWICFLGHAALFITGVTKSVQAEESECEEVYLWDFIMVVIAGIHVVGLAGLYTKFIDIREDSRNRSTCRSLWFLLCCHPFGFFYFLLVCLTAGWLYLGWYCAHWRFNQTECDVVIDWAKIQFYVGFFSAVGGILALLMCLCRERHAPLVLPLHCPPPAVAPHFDTLNTQSQYQIEMTGMHHNQYPNHHDNHSPTIQYNQYPPVVAQPNYISTPLNGPVQVAPAVQASAPPMPTEIRQEYQGRNRHYSGLGTI